MYEFIYIKGNKIISEQASREKKQVTGCQGEMRNGGQWIQDFFGK